MSNLTSAAWWKAAALRALRSAIMIALPYFGAASLFGDVPLLSVGSAAALAAIASLLMSLTGIAEAVGEKVPLWLALLERVTKTVAQALLAGIGNIVLFQDVDWSVVVQSAIIAGLSSLLLGVLAKLPEAAPVPVSVEPAPYTPTVPVELASAVITPGGANQPSAGVPPSGDAYEPRHASE